MRSARPIATLVAVAMLPAAVLAADDNGGRYTMSPTEDGVVRLDTQTGVMALCQRKDGAWACEDMDDSQRTLMAEIDKLRSENKFLKDQVEQMEETLGLDEKGSEDPQPKAKLALPNEADVDKAFDYLERMLDKLQQRMEKLEEKHGKRPETEL